MPDRVCPSCGNPEMTLFYESRHVPVYDSAVVSTYQDAIGCPRGDISLGFCEECGFISNIAFEPERVDYSRAYEDQQCFSPTFSDFVRDLANHLVKKYDLYDKEILEIGCGKGDFLVLLCEMGHNRGIGIDPAYVEGRLSSHALTRLSFVRDYYSERHLGYRPQMLCCRHTLEHVHSTRDFVTMVWRGLYGGASRGIAFFEVPDVRRLLRELAFWDIYYEHCSYFSPGSLSRLFRSCRFEVTDLYAAFNDQYLLLEARPIPEVSAKPHVLEDTPPDLRREVEYFSSNYRKKLNSWKDKFAEFKADGKRVAVWGSGSKSVSFIATTRTHEQIEFAIDVNPNRQGKFLPGIGRKIVAPEFLRKSNVDVVIVMNPVYSREIQQMLGELGVSPEVMTVE